MSSSKMPGAGKNKPKDNSGTDGDAEVLCSPHGTKNIQPSIQPTVQQTAASEKSQKMDLEQTPPLSKSPTAALSKSPTAALSKSPTAALSKSPNAALSKSPTAALSKSPTAALAKSPTSSLSTVREKLDDMQIEDIPNLITDLFQTNMSSDQPFSKPSFSNLLSPDENKNVSMEPTTVTKTKASTGLNISGPSVSKAPLQNPLIKTQADYGSSTAVASGFKFPALKPLAFPLTKRTMKDSSELADACRFFLNFMKSKRTDLIYKESELDKCSADIQKALTDSEQICLKLENEPNTQPEEMSAAVTQAQKLAYLLSISYRSFKKLDELGSKLQGQLQSYTKEAEMFHESADRLLQYIVDTIIEKSKQSL